MKNLFTNPDQIYALLSLIIVAVAVILAIATKTTAGATNSTQNH
jgi:hypothetical protein